VSLFLRIIGQLFLILIGYAAASLAASAFIHLLFLGSAGFDAEEARWVATGSIFVSVPVVALFVSYFAFLPAVIAIGVGEVTSARDWLFYAVAGALVGAAVVALFWLNSPTGLEEVPETLPGDSLIGSPFVLATLVGAGMIGGIAYWMVAGRLAGGWRPEVLPKDARRS
jgi:hypothetical protein